MNYGEKKGLGVVLPCFEKKSSDMENELEKMIHEHENIENKAETKSKTEGTAGTKRKTEDNGETVNRFVDDEMSKFMSRPNKGPDEAENGPIDDKAGTKTKTENNAKTAKSIEYDEIRKFMSSPNKGPEADSGPPKITVVPRDEWSKIERPEEYTGYMEPLQFALITHTGTSTCSKSEECIRILRTIQRIHLALGYADIVYNFLIGGDGKVYEGRGWSCESAWIPKYYEVEEAKCIKIAHIGYYGDFSKKKVEGKQAKLALDLLETGMYKNHVKWNVSIIPDYNEPHYSDIV